ncbi:hypothetical protein [Micromonospora sp. LOL_021]|uniref:hypothetical protein n=1 Tax=Micromonospora sp. LOL_021 TaxID=3345417 RepID=UPI003A87F21B
MPVDFLLLFVYVFGGALGAGLGELGATMSGGTLPGGGAGGACRVRQLCDTGDPPDDRDGHPPGAAIPIAMGLTEGIISRFRTMHIARGSVLTGRVAGRRQFPAETG